MVFDMVLFNCFLYFGGWGWECDDDCVVVCDVLVMFDLSLFVVCDVMLLLGGEW